MWVQRPPQVSPYLREKTRKSGDTDETVDGEVSESASSRSFESFLSLERKRSAANDGRLLHGSTLYQLASQSVHNSFGENQDHARRYYKRIHDKASALVIAGIDRRQFDV